jgi:hypothetical protein
MDELMDSDDETMFAALMEEEAEIAVADDEEHLMMLSCLMALCQRTDAKSCRRGSAPGRRKSKPRQRFLFLQGAEAEVGRLLHSLCRLLHR